MSRLPRILLCGAGQMGLNHLRVLRTLSDECQVAGVVEPRAERQARVGQTPVFEELDEALDQTRPDGVIVATPTSTHFEVARVVLERGIPLLIEKPVAPTAAEGDELARIARTTGTPCCVGHVERFNPAIVAVRRLVRDGQLGELVNLSARRVGGTPADVAKAGDVLVDLAVHDIDIARWLFGSLQLRAAVGHFSGAIDSATMLLTGGAVTIDVHVNWVTPIKLRQLTVTGSEGHMDVNLITQQVTLTRKNPLLTSGERDVDRFFDDYLLSFAAPDQTQIGILKREPLREELKAFALALATPERTSSSLVSIEDGVEALRLAERARLLADPERASASGA